MLIEPEADLGTAVEMLPIEVMMCFLPPHVPAQDLVDCLVGHAAHLVDARVVEPHVARGDAVRGRGPVEHQAAQAVQREPRVRPAAVAHQVLREVTVVATGAVVPLDIREIT